MKVKPLQPMTRFVYIMKVRLPFYDFRWFGHLLQAKALYKIGVAKDPSSRQKQVDSSTPAVLTLYKKYYCQQATKHESHLHKKYNAFKFHLEADGGTEVFLLNSIQMREAKRYLLASSLQSTPVQNFVALIVFLTLAICSYIYLSTLSH